MTTVTTIAGDAYRAFERADYRAFERADRGSAAEHTLTFVRTKDDAPQWVKDAVKAAHQASGELYLPCDWIYDTAREAFGFIAELETEGIDVEETLSDAQAGFSENADVSSADLENWLSDYPGARGAIREAERQGLFSTPGELDGMLMVGQYFARGEIFAAIAKHVREQADESEES